MKEETSMSVIQRLGGLNWFLLRAQNCSVCYEGLVFQWADIPAWSWPTPSPWPCPAIPGYVCTRGLHFKRKIISIIPCFAGMFRRKTTLLRGPQIPDYWGGKNKSGGNSTFWRADFSEVLDLWDGGKILKNRTYLAHKRDPCKFLLFLGETFQNNFSFYILHNI